MCDKAARQTAKRLRAMKRIIRGSKFASLYRRIIHA